MTLKIKIQNPFCYFKKDVLCYSLKASTGYKNFFFSICLQKLIYQKYLSVIKLKVTKNSTIIARL